MSETPEEFADRLTAPCDEVMRDMAVASIRARDLSQRISGACDLALALGWSTGHGESMDALIGESRDNLRRERAKVLEEAADGIETMVSGAFMAEPKDYKSAILAQAIAGSLRATAARARAAAEREGKA